MRIIGLGLLFCLGAAVALWRGNATIVGLFSLIGALLVVIGLSTGLRRRRRYDNYYPPRGRGRQPSRGRTRGRGRDNRYRY